MKRVGNGIGVGLLCLLAGGCTPRSPATLDSGGADGQEDGTEETDAGSENGETTTGPTETDGGETTDGSDETTTGGPEEGAVAIAMDEPAPRGIDVDATHVYWANESTGKVWRVVTDGSEDPELLADAPGSAPYGLAVDDTHVYWADSSESGRINKLPKSGGAVVILAPDVPSPRAIAIDETHVYWVDAETVGRVDKDGSNQENLAWGVGFLGGLAVTTDAVYWSDNAGSNAEDGGFIPDPDPGPMSGRILRAPKGGGAAMDIAPGQEFPIGIDTDDESVYWVNNSNGGGGWSESNSVRRAPLIGGPLTNLATDQDRPWSVLIHEGYVYYGTSTAIWRVDREADAPAEAIAEMQYLPRYLAADAVALYWTNGDGSIMKLAFD